jgi:hypothetical protein
MLNDIQGQTTASRKQLFPGENRLPCFYTATTIWFLQHAKLIALKIGK